MDVDSQNAADLTDKPRRPSELTGKVLVFLFLLIPRLCIPVSFLLCFVFAPISMLLDAPNWPRRLVEMWEDPL